MHPHDTSSRQQFVAICQCGCGRPTLFALKTSTAAGRTKGQPQQFIHGHCGPRPSFSRRIITGYGYAKRYLPTHPHADAGGYVPEHRLVMEGEIGRYLLPTELVHHKNKDKLDNRPENLEIVTKSQHGKIHAIDKPMFQPRLTGWSMKHDACVSCGTIERKHFGFGLCQRCYHRRRVMLSKHQPDNGADKSRSVSV